VLLLFFAVYILATLVFFPRVSHSSAQIDQRTSSYILRHGNRYKFFALVAAFYSPIVISLIFIPFHTSDTFQLISFCFIECLAIIGFAQSLIGAFRATVLFSRESISARYAFSKSNNLEWRRITDIKFLHRKRIIQFTQDDGSRLNVSIYIEGLATLLDLVREVCPLAIDSTLEQWMRRNKFVV
jgi:hypothetical protein